MITFTRIKNLEAAVSRCAAIGWADGAPRAEHWCDLERGHAGAAVPVVFHRCSCGWPWPIVLDAVSQSKVPDAVSQSKVNDAVSQSYDRAIFDLATRPSYFERFLEPSPPRPWWTRLWWRLEYRQHRIRELVALWIAPWLEPE